MAKKLNLDMNPGESKLQYYRRLAKAADQRMVRLEQLSTQKGFSGVTKYAYRKAVYDINIYRQDDDALPRWNTKPPTVNQLLNEKIQSMIRFLQSPTSTKKGIVDTYKRRADTINKNYGTKMTWQEVADYFQKGIADKLTQEFGSKTALVAIGRIQRAKRNLIKGVKDNKSVKMEGPVTDAALAILRKKKYAPGDVLALSAKEKKRIRESLES